MADRLAAIESAAELLVERWNALSPEEQADVTGRIDSAWSASAPEYTPGDGTESEFQRFGRTFGSLAVVLQLAAAGSLLVAPPAAAVLEAGALLYGALAAAGSLLTPDRTRELAVVLDARVPGLYAILCAHPGLVYGMWAKDYEANPDGFYLLSLCSDPAMPTSPEMVGVDGLLNVDALADNLRSELSTSSTSSTLVKVILAAGALWGLLS